MSDPTHRSHPVAPDSARGDSGSPNGSGHSAEIRETRSKLAPGHTSNLISPQAESWLGRRYSARCWRARVGTRVAMRQPH